MLLKLVLYFRQMSERNISTMGLIDGSITFFGILTTKLNFIMHIVMASTSSDITLL